jgi:hypothetical protein
MKKVSHKGALCCSVGDAVHYLRTNANKIRALMGSGQLAYTQLRLNGNLYVSVGDLVKLQTQKMAAQRDGTPLK